jgi:hypothetical protein
LKKILIFSLFTTLVISKLIILKLEFTSIDSNGYLSKIWIFIKNILIFFKIDSLNVNDYIFIGPGFEKSSLLINTFIGYFPIIFIISFIFYIIVLILKNMFKRRQ